MRTRNATHSTERVARRSTRRALASASARAADASVLRCPSCLTVLFCFANAFTPDARPAGRNQRRAAASRLSAVEPTFECELENGTMMHQLAARNNTLPKGRAAPAYIPGLPWVLIKGSGGEPPFLTCELKGAGRYRP